MLLRDVTLLLHTDCSLHQRMSSSVFKPMIVKVSWDHKAPFLHKYSHPCRCQYTRHSNELYSQRDCKVQLVEIVEGSKMFASLVVAEWTAEAEDMKVHGPERGLASRLALDF